MRVVLHPEARKELRSAALWYDERRAGLGTEFVAEVSAMLERIASSPHAFSWWPGIASPRSIRRAVLRRFPYLIAFEKQHDRVVVLAIGHGKRRPLLAGAGQPGEAVNGGEPR